MIERFPHPVGHVVKSTVLAHLDKDGRIWLTEQWRAGWAPDQDTAKYERKNGYRVAEAVERKTITGFWRVRVPGSNIYQEVPNTSESAHEILRVWRWVARSKTWREE